MAQRRNGNGIIHQREVALTTTPQRISTAGINLDGIVVQMAIDAAVDVRIGGPGIGPALGYVLLATADGAKPDEWSQTITAQEVWACTVSGTCNVTVLEVY